MKYLAGFLLVFLTLSPIVAKNPKPIFKKTKIQKPFQLQEIKVEEKKEFYKISVYYPQIKDFSDATKQKTVNQLIKKAVLEKVQQFRKSAKDTLKALDAKPEEVKGLDSDLFLTYGVNQASNQLLSVSFSENFYMIGAPHPNIQFFTLNIDLSQGKFFNLNQIFLPNKRYLEKLSKLIRKELIKEMKKKLISKSKRY